MHVVGKIWGETHPVLITPLIEIHHVFGKANGFCSRHKHAHKWNGFFVIRGKLEIDIWANDYDLIDRTIVGPSQFTTVSPGEYHQFRIPADADCEFLEIYYLEPLGEDIIRDSVGGMTKQK